MSILDFLIDRSYVLYFDGTKIIYDEWKSIKELIASKYTSFPQCAHTTVIDKQTLTNILTDYPSTIPDINVFMENIGLNEGIDVAYFNDNEFVISPRSMRFMND